MKVVLKHGGRWLHFQNPEKVLTAERMEEVLPAIAEAEQSGLYAAGFIAYEAAPAFDAVLQTHESAGLPLLMFGLFNAPDVLEYLEEVPGAHFKAGAPRPSVSKEQFTRAIAQIKEHIAAGATYQVNYTYRLHADFEGDAWAFFNALVKGQKTEHAAFIETGGFAVCSASPELFFCVDDGILTARPMKGTAKRGLTFSEDRRRAEALQASEKDRAENIMIVDMIRNDIGRVAVPGSVETVSTFDVEKYPTVWQMTSTVQGRLAQSRVDTANGGRAADAAAPLRLGAILKALYPCASITGAPKAKTMEIIRDLEPTPRGIYTGTIGFLTPRGEAAFNVAIRTALIQDGRLEFGVGGGIVWDSNAASEFEETLTKARVLTQPRPEFELLETMLYMPGAGIFLLHEHLQRLGRSAAYFDIPVDLNTLRGRLEKLHTFESVPFRVRLRVVRDGTVHIETFALDVQAAAPQGGTQPPLRAVPACGPVDSQDVFLYHKTTHRAVYEAAFAKAAGRAEEVILWNERGEVTEGTFTNVVISKGGKKITPPVACGLLAGTFREHLLQSGEIEEGLVTLDDLRRADEVWLVNSVRKWQKAVLEDLDESDC